MAYNTLADFGGNAWPPEGASIQKADERKFATEIAARIAEIPFDMTGLDGQLVVFKAASGGLIPSSLAGTQPVDFSHLPVRRGSPHVITITSSTALTMNDHNGSWLRCDNAAQIDLTFALGGNPTDSVQTGFNVVIWPIGAGAVRLLLDGLVNGDADEFTKVPPKRSAGCWVDGTVLRTSGSLIA